MRPQEQMPKRASAERHEISRPEIIEQLTEPDSISDRFRFLRLAALALDGPDGTPYAEHDAEHDDLIWNVGLWKDRAEMALQLTFMVRVGPLTLEGMLA